jgi:hypothetical protein
VPDRKRPDLRDLAEAHREDAANVILTIFDHPHLSVNLR